jgi:hypothetical protein
MSSRPRFYKSPVVTFYEDDMSPFLLQDCLNNFALSLLNIMWEGAIKKENRFVSLDNLSHDENVVFDNEPKRRLRSWQP